MSPAPRSVNKGRCALGYVSKTLGVSHEELKNYPEHEIWKRVGFYLAQLAVNVFFTTSAETIVIGGGLSHSPRLFGYVVDNFDRLVNGYVQFKRISEGKEHSILKRPSMDDTNGLLGAVLAFKES